MVTNSKEYMREYYKTHKKTVVINDFVKEFHLLEVQNMQSICEDFLNPKVIKTIKPTKSQKIIETKKFRNQYDQLKQVVKDKITKTSRLKVINWFLEYKNISREAYNEFFIKLQSTFENMFYCFAVAEIYKKFSDCEEVITACEKEFKR